MIEYEHDAVYKILLELLITLGGFSVILYFLLWLLSALCIRKQFNDYLIQNVLIERPPDDQRDSSSDQPAAEVDRSIQMKKIQQELDIVRTL